jgi:hypothetical protein
VFYVELLTVGNGRWTLNVALADDCVRVRRWLQDGGSWFSLLPRQWQDTELRSVAAINAGLYMSTRYPFGAVQKGDLRVCHATEYTDTSMSHKRSAVLSSAMALSVVLKGS